MVKAEYWRCTMNSATEDTSLIQLEQVNTSLSLNERKTPSKDGYEAA
jgi:hypothetical protein